MSKEIAKKFENQLSKYYLQTIHDLLEEQEINPQQFMHMAVNQIKRNSRLLEIFKSNPASIFSSILTCAEFGLSPTSQMGEAWLIPYGKECQFQIGYQGLTKILYKNPDVQNITAECVFENDDFDYSLGLSPTLEHKPATQDRGSLIAVYCVVRFANQQPIFKVMTIQELKTIQGLSKAGNRSVWFSKTDPQYWMLKKTVFKQLCKLLPKHLNMSKVISYDNIVEGGGSMRLDDDNKPIVIEEELTTRADKFEKAMGEDKPPLEHEGVLPGIDPKIKSANINIAQIVEEKTEKIFTKQEMKDIKEDIFEKCPVPGVDAIGINLKSTQIEEGLDHKGEDDVVFDDRDGVPTMRDVDDLPPTEELISLIKEETTPEPISDEQEHITRKNEDYSPEEEDEEEIPTPEELIPEIMEDDTPTPVEEPRVSQEKMLEEYSEDIDFEKEEEQRRQRRQNSQDSFLNSNVSEQVDVEL